MAARYRNTWTSWLINLALLFAWPAHALEPFGPPWASESSTHTAQGLAEVPAEVQGWFDGAIAAHARGNAEEALRLQKQVMAWLTDHTDAPDVFKAKTLINLGNFLNGMGQRQEALAPTEEAIKIFRQLAKFNPAFLNDLASALNNLGVFLNEVGRREEALAPTEEAVKIRRELAKTNPSFLNDLAGSLNNLGIRFGELRRHQEALAPTVEALKIYRHLANNNPIHLNDLAGSLNNLGVLLSYLGLRQESLSLTEEAIKIRRELARTNPVLQSDLALVLNNLSVRLNEEGRQQEFADSDQEALNYYRELGRTNQAFLPSLAMKLSQLDSPPQALAPTQEALKTLRQLEKNNPIYLGDLASSLNNSGIRLSKLAPNKEAIASVEEAVSKYRELAKANPAYLSDLALALNNLGYLQLQLGEPEIPREAFEEALSLYRSLVVTNPAFQVARQRIQNNLDELNRKEGIRTGATKVLAASNVSFLPKGDPLISVKRAVVLLWPTFSDKNSGVGQFGTGFVVRRHGDRAWIATALHVVRDLESNAMATKVEAELFTGPLPPGHVAPRVEVVLGQDQTVPSSGDAPILLKVLGLPADIKPLPLATSPAQGSLTVVGHPSKQGPWSVISYPLLTSSSDVLLLNGGLEPGASGSPVLNASRQVVGVVYDSPEPSKQRPIAQVSAFPVQALVQKMKP